MKSNSKIKHACRVSDKLTLYSFMIAKVQLKVLHHFQDFNMFILVTYFKASLKNQTNKIYENGYFCDFIADTNKVNNL